MKPSERLTYRKLDRQDYELYRELYTDDEVMQYAYLDAFQTEEATKKAFEHILLLQEDVNEGTQFVATLSDGIPIGIVDYEVNLAHRAGHIYEIGYFIKPTFWGQGYGSEMGKAMVNYLFESFPAIKLVASCNGLNRKSEAIMKKLGMTREGIFRNARFKAGKWEDEIKYGILKEEWLQLKKL